MNKNLKAIILIIIFSLSIFWQFFINGLSPYPGNYMLAWYEPWKTDFSLNKTIIIAHKPVADDTFRQLFPYKILTADAIRKFELPLWNPYNGAGMPLMATMHAGFLNPFNLLFLFLPNFLAWSIYILIQSCMISVFTYLYCKKIGQSIKASIFSSLSFCLSGFVVARLLFGEYIYTLSMLPLMLFLLELFIKDPSSKKKFFLPFSVLFMFISGQPQVTFYVTGFSLAYFFYRYNTLNQDIKTALKKYLPLFLILFLTGLGMSSVQIIPTIELFGNASINSLSSKFIFERFLLPLQQLVTIFIPNYFGNQSTYNYWGTTDYIETIISIGTIPAFFAYLAITNKKDYAVKFYAVSILITILFAINWFGSKIIYSLPIPIVSTGVPTRIFALTTFSFSILSGFGFDYWIKIKSFEKGFIKKISSYFFLLLVILSLTLIFYIKNLPCNNPVIISCRTIALRNTLFELTFFAGFLFLFYFGKKIQKFSNLYPKLIIFIIIFLGLYNSNKFLPFSPSRTFNPDNKLIKLLQEKTLPDRVFGFDKANIKTDLATSFHFFDPDYYDPLYYKTYGELIGFANTGKLLDILPRSDVEIINNSTISASLERRRSRLLNILGVKYLIFNKSELPNTQNLEVFWEDSNWYVKVNKNALPRVYAVENFEVEENKEKMLQRLFDPSFDIEKTVIFQENPNIKIEKSEKIISHLKITDYEGNKAQIDTVTNSDALLILSDNYFPGWKAFLDEKETKIYRANYSLRSIFLPKGKHNVTFAYKPMSLTIGIIISSISLLVFFVVYYRKKIGKIIRAFIQK